MRKTSSTIKRVQDLLTARRAKRFEREPGRFTAEGRAAHVEAERLHDSAFGAGRPPDGGPGGGVSVGP